MIHCYSAVTLLTLLVVPHFPKAFRNFTAREVNELTRTGVESSHMPNPRSKRSLAYPQAETRVRWLNQAYVRVSG